MALDNRTDSLADPCTAVDTLDSRVRSLERILTASNPHGAGESALREDRDDVSAVRHLAAISPRLRQLTALTEPRVKVPTWDGGDVLAARLLLTDLRDAIQSCRVLARVSSARLHGMHSAIKSGRKLLRREAARAASSSETPKL